MADNEQPKNKTTLTDALAKVSELSGKVEQLQKDLDTANARADAAESSLSAEQAAHSKTKSECETLKQAEHDFEKSVAAKAAAIAAQSGVETPPPAKTEIEVTAENIDELADKIEKASGVEKANLINKHYDAILATVRKGTK